MDQQIAFLAVAIGALWIVFTGMVWMVRGPRGAVAINVRLVRTIFWVLRWAIGGFLVWIGTLIQGRRAPPRP